MAAHRLRDVTVLGPLLGIPLGLLRLREVGVPNAVFHELERYFHRPRKHQVAFGGGLVKTVGVGRNPVLHCEELARVVVDVVLGRGGQTEQQGVEVAEQLAVLGAHGPVRLVDDDQVEGAGAEAATPALSVTSISTSDCPNTPKPT